MTQSKERKSWPRRALTSHPSFLPSNVFFKLQRSPWQPCDIETASRTPKDKEHWNDKGKMWSITIWWFSSWILGFGIFDSINMSTETWFSINASNQKQETNSLSVQNFISNSTVSTIVLLIQRSVLLISAGFCGFWESLVTSQVTKKKKTTCKTETNWIRCMGLQRVLKISSNKLLELRAGTLFLKRWETGPLKGRFLEFTTMDHPFLQSNLKKRHCEVAFLMVNEENTHILWVCTPPAGYWDRAGRACFGGIELVYSPIPLRHRKSTHPCW